MTIQRVGVAALLAGVACTSSVMPSLVPPSPTGSAAATTPSRSAIEDARGVLAQQHLTRSCDPPCYVSLVTIEERSTPVADTTGEAGFELVVSGTERITVDGQTTDLANGHAIPIAQGAPRQRQADRATSYFISLRPVDRRERYLAPDRSILYESADLPAAATPPGDYDDALVMLVLASGQVVPPHMHGGIEPTYVIEGTIELRIRGKPVRRLSAGEADTVLPDTPLLITNVGPTIARVLVMLATPAGKPVQSPADPP